MKFGKLASLEDVNFKLPAEPEENRKVLSALEPLEAEGIMRIGCTGFSMREWVGSVYPPGTRSKDYLRAYGQQFQTIEFNTTHYRIPKQELIARWSSEVGKQFRFCPKVLQRISHSKDLGLATGLSGQFWRAVSGFGERLGPCFMQLPETFGPEGLPQLLRFMDLVPNDIQLAVELRHPAWFGSGTPLEQLSEAMQEMGASLVLTDVAGRRDVLHMRLTAGFALIRFVGNGMHPTDMSRIEEWAQRIRNWFAAGLRTLYFFSHQPDNLLAPELSIYLARALGSPSGFTFQTPRLHSGRQGQLF